MRSLRFGVAVVLGLLPLIMLAAPVPAPKPKAKTTPEPLPLCELMEVRFDFQGFHDRKTTLEEALSFLGKKLRIEFAINTKAFEAEQITNVEKAEIANPDPVPPMSARIGTVVRSILKRIPSESGATFLVRDNFIEITTYAVARAEAERTLPTDAKGRPRRISAAFEERTLLYVAKALGRRGDFTIVVDPRVKPSQRKITITFIDKKIIDAVSLVARRAGLCSFQKSNMFYLTTKDRLEKLQRNLRHHDTHLRRYTPEPEYEPRPGEWVGGLKGGFVPEFVDP